MDTNEMGGWTWISHMPLQLGRWPEITAEPSPPCGGEGWIWLPVWARRLRLWLLN